MKELFEALRAGDHAHIAQLVQADPSLEIFAACMLGDTARVDALTTGNRSLVTGLSSDGWTPLHLASFYGKLDTAKLLLNKGASPTTRSTNAMNNMPLHAAVSGKHAELVKVLLEHGAPANAQQSGGWVAMHAAAQNGDLESAVHLLVNGADVSQRADNQQRPIDLALLKGQQDMVEFLEAHGATL